MSNELCAIHFFPTVFSVHKHIVFDIASRQNITIVWTSTNKTTWFLYFLFLSNSFELLFSKPSYVTQTSFAENERYASWTMACLARDSVSKTGPRRRVWRFEKVHYAVIYAQTKLMYSARVIWDTFQNGLSFKLYVVSSSTRIDCMP